MTASKTRRGRLTVPGPRARNSTLSPDTASSQPPVGPVRTCVGCRGTGSRQALLRVVVDPGAHALLVDAGRRMPGRGAWLHPDPHCFELAVRRRAFGRALRVAAPLDVAAVAAHLGVAADKDAGGTLPPAADRR